MSRRAFLPILAAAVVVAVACGGATREHVDVRIRGLVIHAELARTPAEREQGLSGRSSLAHDGGMLFVFEQDLQPGFWMRGMRLPLDFIWISRDLRVVDTTENVPPPEPGTSPEQLPLYRPGAPVLYVLEVNAGTVVEAGVRVGDTVMLGRNVSAERPP